jgi:hypothetical protein
MVYEGIYTLEKACVWLEQILDNKFADRKRPGFAQLLLWICSGFSTVGCLRTCRTIHVGAGASVWRAVEGRQQGSSFDSFARAFHVVIVKSLYTE